jgi:hypothetical protein
VRYFVSTDHDYVRNQIIGHLGNSSVIQLPGPVKHVGRPFNRDDEAIFRVGLDSLLLSKCNEIIIS